MQVLKISAYLAALVLANFVVLWFGKTGLIFTAVFLIPFDFVMRAMFHETWKGAALVVKMGLLIVASALLTYLINIDTRAIAMASATGFMVAQVAAGVFYQFNLRRPYWFKVNGSDLVGIAFDSVLFQLVAFAVVDPIITASQIALKFIGGLLWYWVIFVKLQLHRKW